MATVHLRLNAEDRRQQILQAATELFAKQGFEGTTTRQIAEAAGVNEAIIFRHFPSKEELYWEVIEDKCRQSQGRAQIIARLREGGEPAEVFFDLARDFLKRREEDGALSRLLLFTALENHKLSSRFFRTHIAEIYEAIADYIRAGIKAGTFRQVDPTLAARGFLGMLVYHVMIQDLFGGKRYLKMDLAEASRAFTDMWLNGVLSTAEKVQKPLSEVKRPGANDDENLISQNEEQ